MIKKLTLLLCTLAFGAVFAQEATCKKCEIIREENKLKPQPPEYYEDYLKEKKEGIAPVKEETKSVEKEAA